MFEAKTLFAAHFPAEPAQKIKNVFKIPWISRVQSMDNCILKFHAKLYHNWLSYGQNTYACFQILAINMKPVIYHRLYLIQ